MNPIEQLVSNFQDLVAQVPEFLQPLILVLAGAVPFVEGELAAIIGVIGGVNPILAAIAGATGNFLCVLLVVLLSSRARTAVVDRRAARVLAKNARSETQTRSQERSADMAAAIQGAHTTSIATVEAAEAAEDAQPEKPLSKGRQRFNKWLVRFGVPGASILGPLAIPTQITSAILVAGGTPRAWVLLWQAVAIALWTTIGTTSVWIALRVATGA